MNVRFRKDWKSTTLGCFLAKSVGWQGGVSLRQLVSGRGTEGRGGDCQLASNFHSIRAADCRAAGQFPALSRVFVTKDSRISPSLDDRAQEVMALAVDPREPLIQMRASMGEGSNGMNPLSADLASEHRPEPVPPQAQRFMANIDAALSQKILDLAQ